MNQRVFATRPADLLIITPLMRGRLALGSGALTRPQANHSRARMDGVATLSENRAVNSPQDR